MVNVKEGDLIFDEVAKKLYTFKEMDDSDPPKITVELMEGGIRRYNAISPMRVIPTKEKSKVMKALDEVRQAEIKLENALSKCELI